MTRRTLHDELTRAREALARAEARGADPWRLTELRLRYDELLARALDDADRPALAVRTATAARRPEPPLEWTDDAGRLRRGPKEPPQ